MSSEVEIGELLPCSIDVLVPQCFHPEPCPVVVLRENLGCDHQSLGLGAGQLQFKL